MAKKYFSTHSRSSHTYAFYKARKNDPNWREDYLRIHAHRQGKQLILLSLTLLITLFVLFGVYTKYSQNSANQNSHQRNLVSKQPQNINTKFDNLSQAQQLALLLSVNSRNTSETTLVYMANQNEIIFANPSIKAIRYMDQKDGNFKIYSGKPRAWHYTSQISKSTLMSRYYTSQQQKEQTQRIANTIDLSHSSEQYAVNDPQQDTNHHIQANSPSDTNHQLDLDIPAINGGDFKTLMGVWKNGDGDTLNISRDGKVNGTLTLSPVSDPDSTSNRPYVGISDGTTGAIIAFYPIGARNSAGDQSDTSKPRLIMAQQMANYPATSYYYRQ